MAVTFDTAFEKGAGSATDGFSFVSNAGTVPGSVGANSDRVLIGYLAFYDALLNITGEAMTWAGNTMAEIGTLSSGSLEIHLFGLKGDANVTTGAQTIAATWTGSVTGGVALGAVSLYSCDTATGWQNFGTDTDTGLSASSTVTSANGNMAVAGHIDNNATSGSMSAGTQDWEERSLNGNFMMGHRASTSGSTVLTWDLGSSVLWINAKVDVIAAGGVPALTVSVQDPVIGGSVF